MKEVMVKITTNQVNEQGEEDIMEFVTEANGEDGIPAFMIRRLERSSLRC